jgi:hypothetical protein
MPETPRPLGSKFGNAAQMRNRDSAKTFAKMDRLYIWWQYKRVESTAILCH